MMINGYGIYLFSLTLLCTSHLYSALSLRKLKRTIDIVEARQTLENRLIKDDLESVFEKLENLEEKIDNITGAVDRTEEQDGLPSFESGSGRNDVNSVKLVSENVKSLKEDFLRLLKAFGDEKEQSVKSRKLFDETNEKYFRKIKQELTESMKSILHEQITKVKQEIYANLTEQIKENEQRETAVTDGLDSEILDKSGTEIEKTSDRFESCLDLLQKGGKSESGIYTIYPNDLKPAIRVFCDQETDGGGWTVFQRRKDGSVDFYRDWNDYKVGFGDLDGEFWLGNDYLSVLTSAGKHDLRIDLVGWENDEECNAAYSGFRVGPETTNYTLFISDFIGGSCKDSLTYHNNTQFSTKDRDNDQRNTHCAQTYKGGWWYKKCLYSGLNGKYGTDPETKGSGVYWYYWKKSYVYYSKFSEMKFKQH